MVGGMVASSHDGVGSVLALVRDEVAAAKSVKEPFVVVDGDVTGSHGWGQWPEK